jgi:hypothetical protein
VDVDRFRVCESIEKMDRVVAAVSGEMAAMVPQRHRHRTRRSQIPLEDPSGNPIELFQPAES